MIRKLEWMIPVAVLAVATTLILIFDLDMAAQRALYSADSGWQRGSEIPWSWCYDFGVVPAWLIAVPALFVAIAAIWRKSWRHIVRPAVFLVLTMSIGPGLIVNNVLKQNWGRPRPKDIVEFGGKHEFVPVLQKGPRERGNSFASGHAATAFFLMTPWFIYRFHNRRRATAGLIVGVSYGLLVGLARMIQGAHFASDVLWAFGVVWFTAFALDRWLKPGETASGRAAN